MENPSLYLNFASKLNFEVLQPSIEFKLLFFFNCLVWLTSTHNQSKPRSSVCLQCVSRTGKMEKGNPPTNNLWNPSLPQLISFKYETVSSLLFQVFRCFLWVLPGRSSLQTLRLVSTCAALSSAHVVRLCARGEERVCLSPICSRYGSTCAHITDGSENTLDSSCSYRLERLEKVSDEYYEGMFLCLFTGSGLYPVSEAPCFTERRSRRGRLLRSTSSVSGSSQHSSSSSPNSTCRALLTCIM